MYEKFVEPCKKTVDLVVPNSGNSHTGYATIVDLLACKAQVFASQHQGDSPSQPKVQDPTPRIASLPSPDGVINSININKRAKIGV
jgi:hypothetical protein